MEYRNIYFIYWYFMLLFIFFRDVWEDRDTKRVSLQSDFISRD